MNKERIIQMVTSHHGLFSFGAGLYNGIRLGNKLRAKGCMVSIGVSVIKGLKIISHGCDNEVVIGDFVRIQNSTIILHGDHNRVTIHDYAYLNQIELYTEDANNEISIGAHTYLCGNAHLAAIEGTRILIGDRCMFSADLHFRTGDSHAIVDMQDNRINPSKDIVVEDHVWIGTKVTCLKGVHIAKDCVVAATTTLCKRYDVPNAIIAGVPGRITKTGINWKRER